MSTRAWLYIWVILLTGLGLTVWAYLAFPFAPSELILFAQLTVITTLTQVFKVVAPGRQSYHISPIFFFASLVLLSPFLFILVLTIAAMLEWLKERLTRSPLLKDWYIQPFNISTIIIGGLAARGALDRIAAQVSFPFGIPAWLPAVLVAASIFVLANHFLIGLALLFARGISLRQSGIFSLENLTNELILVYLGYAVAVLWTPNFWLIPLVLSPLVLMYRALKVPLLEQEAQTDGKTGLWNARHFMEIFTAELNRAKRFNHPLSFIMADLDLLRNINNTYGHLAGDAVLIGVGKIIRETIREYDLAARFGGEEFSLALPETEPEEAYLIAERLRCAVESSEFHVAMLPNPIHATISFGIACFPADATTAIELIHNADLAVYQAKLQGRNCIVSAPEVPAALKLEHAPVDGHLAATYAQLAQTSE